MGTTISIQAEGNETYSKVIHLRRGILCLCPQPQSAGTHAQETKSPLDVPRNQHPEVPPTEESFQGFLGKSQALRVQTALQGHALFGQPEFVFSHEPTLTIPGSARERGQSPESDREGEERGNEIHPSPSSVAEMPVEVGVNASGEKTSGHGAHTRGHIEYASSANDFIGAVPTTQNVVD